MSGAGQLPHGAVLRPKSRTLELVAAIGPKTAPGCLIAGLFVLFVPNIAESVSTGLAGAVYGVILLIVIFVMPVGCGSVRLAVAQLSRLRQS
jgi:hypothetical protein